MITDFVSGQDRIDFSGLGASGQVTLTVGSSTVVYQAGTGGAQGGVTVNGAVQGGDLRLASGATVSITGTGGADLITGSAAVDQITAGGGDDTIIGGLGADVLTGGAGADTFVYGAVSDAPFGAGEVIVDFTAGADKLDFTGIGAGGGVAISLEGGTTVYYEAAGSAAQGQISLFGNVVWGSSLVLAANTTVYIGGSSAADVINGSSGVDVINGAGGDDTIAGGGGADVLTGGAGADTFLFRAVSDSAVGAVDVITDFDPNLDLIDLSAVDASTAAGSQRFTLVGAFTHVAGQLIAYQSGGAWHLDGDVDADGVADFSLTVQTTSPWVPADDGVHLRL